MSALDRGRPFGEIYGDADGKRFEQDGQFFDGEGKPIAAAPESAEAPKPKRKPAAAAPAENLETVDQTAAQLLS
jgi:hypothetical protein